MSHIIEILGYIASAMIAISFMMKNITHIRMINLIGCLLFCIYGFMRPAYPVLVANGLIVLIQIYHLWQDRKKLKKQTK